MKIVPANTLMVILFSDNTQSLSVMPDQAAVILEQDAAVRPMSGEASSSYAHHQAVPHRRRLEPRISPRKSTLCPGRRRLIKSENYSGYSPPRRRVFPGRGAALEQTAQLDVVRTRRGLRCLRIPERRRH